MMSSALPTMAALRTRMFDRQVSRVWPHALALFALLMACSFLVSNGRISNADEGAVLSQLEIIDTYGSWMMPNPLPSIDPDGSWFGIENSDLGATGFLTYGKHPMYPTAMAPFYAAFGYHGLLSASVLGTVATAWAAAALARRWRPSAAVATLWVVGVATPIFFDSFWAMAHTIGAAFATVSLLGAIAVVVDRRRIHLVTTVFGVAGAALFRSEGVLWGLALGVAVALWGSLDAWRRARAEAPGTSPRASVLRWVRRLDPFAVATSALAGGAAMAVWWLDGRWFSALAQGDLEAFRIVTEDIGWLEGRWKGIATSVVQLDMNHNAIASLSALAAVAAAVIGATALRRDDPDEGRLKLAAVVGSAAVAGAAIALIAGSASVVIAGVVFASPFVFLGLAAMRRDVAALPGMGLSLGASGVFMAAIVLTQYPQGGGFEWGGRYFHLVLPTLTAISMVVVAEGWARVRGGSAVSLGTRRAVSTVVLAFAAVTAAQQLDVQVASRQGPADLAERIAEISAGLHDGIGGDAGGEVGGEAGGEPGRGAIVVVDHPALGRAMWAEAVHGRYLLIDWSDPGELTRLGERMSAAGVREFLYITASDPQQRREQVPGYRWDPQRSAMGTNYHFLVMTAD